ncbi:hypothetical protein BZL33_19365 [Escherichia coli]|nr:hypothetical protein BZL33_19365 [Escherichia coli]
MTGGVLKNIWCIKAVPYPGVSGRINSLTPSAGVHFWLEALEPDFIPMTSDESNRLNQGVFVDDWGRPEKYLVYKSRPVSGV